MTTTDRERDEREIANLIVRYARLIDDGRAPEAAELFADDGSWWLGDECKAVGRNAVRALLSRRGANLARTSRHVCSNLLVEVADDGTSATSSCVLTLWRVDRDEPAPHPVAGPAPVGDYVDQFVRADAGWRIQRRELRPVFVAAPNAAA